VFKLLYTSEFSYPKELFGSWACFTLFKNHPSLNGIGCFYFNDKYPSGNIYISDQIFNDYPDSYGTWKIDNDSENFIVDRAFVSPNLRNKGIGKASTIYGTKIIDHYLNKKIHHNYGSEIGNRLYSSAFNTDIIENTPTENAIDFREDFFNQPIYPYVFFGKRILE
jgi:GNAT superfamily N-acetyltransferase